MSPACVVLLVLAGCTPQLSGTPQARTATPVPETVAADPTYRTAVATLAAARERTLSDVQARNVILFVGDGMSLATVTAARILEGQIAGGSGEENALSFEHMPWIGLAKTYTVNAQVADSGGTATALLAGVKTKSDVLSVSAAIEIGDCAATPALSVPTLFELAEDAGLATGIVTTARVTHATPAAAYAHSPNREWEADANLPPSAAGCSDIAGQLVQFPHGDGIDVVLGGGRAPFLPRDSADPEDRTIGGWRLDGRDLTWEWRQRFGDGAAYVWTATQLAGLDLDGVEHLLGLFEPSHMHYEVERGSDLTGEPSLSEMTRTALELLRRRGPRGYVLLVEAGRIDHGHHAGNAFRALHDTIEYSNAVRVALEGTDAADTLIVVTADHGHVFDIGGYSARGNPILGKVRGVGPDGRPEAADALDLMGRPYTAVAYLNGPGYAGASDVQPEGPKRYPHQATKSSPAHGRPDLSAVDTTDGNYLQEAALPLASETHSATDVPVYARGPGAHLLAGAYEQNYIFHVMRHALRL
jgi:alkaline phosphatase